MRREEQAVIKIHLRFFVPTALQHRPDGIRHRAEKFLFLLREPADALRMGGHDSIDAILDQHRHTHAGHRAMFRQQLRGGKPRFPPEIVDHHRNPFPNRIPRLRMGAAFDRQLPDEVIPQPASRHDVEVAVGLARHEDFAQLHVQGRRRFLHRLVHQFLGRYSADAQRADTREYRLKPRHLRCILREEHPFRHVFQHHQDATLSPIGHHVEPAGIIEGAPVMGQQLILHALPRTQIALVPGDGIIQQSFSQRRLHALCLRRRILDQFRELRVFEDEKALAHEAQTAVNAVAQPGQDLRGGGFGPDRPGGFGTGAMGRGHQGPARPESPMIDAAR
ncbi:MAG: hypothetical protein LZF62_300110 [Nitrospira sp.]|nr:MAG: hypothetical protein LZF62_300110 [Nitrospira sp.]